MYNFHVEVKSIHTYCVFGDVESPCLDVDDGAREEDPTVLGWKIKLKRIFKKNVAFNFKIIKNAKRFD